MRVAFWNVNMGRTSRQQRRDTFSDWCAWAQPDLLILEEVSNTLTRNDDDNIEDLADMTQLDFVNTLDVNDDPTTKCLSALIKTAHVGSYEARTLRFPGLEARRALIKVVHNSGIVVWGIHANASRRGGLDAIAHVDAHLNSLAGANAVVGGDFNCRMTDAPGTLDVCHPLNWAGNAIAFTQWNQRADSMVTTQARRTACHVTTNMMSHINPNFLIDYVACGGSRNAVALQNCQDEAMWQNILREFDHCPVMFTIT